MTNPRQFKHIMLAVNKVYSGHSRNMCMEIITNIHQIYSSLYFFSCHLLNLYSTLLYISMKDVAHGGRTHLPIAPPPHSTEYKTQLHFSAPPLNVYSILKFGLHSFYFKNNLDLM